MDFLLMRFEIAIVILIITLLLADLFIPSISKKILGLMAVFSLGIFIIWSLFEKIGALSNTFYTLDPLALWSKQFSMIATLLTILMSIRIYNEKTDHLIEYIILQLLACLGMMIVASAADFISFFVSLELVTISFYVLVSFHRKNLICLEAALKYLIYGALFSGVLLYGIALICGMSGEIQFSKISEYVTLHHDSVPILLGLALILAGLAFKISAVPFHWWTPDVYEGAPIPTVALLSISSKGIGFVLLIRLLFQVFKPCQMFWLPLLVFGAGASIIYSNLAALSQTNLKRLMGYSSITHSGYMLLGLIASSVTGLSATLYYLFGYLLANALIFGVISETVTENPQQEIRLYAGLAKYSAWTASGLLLGLLSLSGIPPLAGFFGKFLVFQSIFEKKFIVLLILAVLGVVLSLYYYLNIVRVVYFSEAPLHRNSTSPAAVTCWVLATLMASTILIGFYPSPWWKKSEIAARCIYP